MTSIVEKYAFFIELNPADEKWCGARNSLHHYAERGCHQELKTALESGTFHANSSSIGNITPLHEAAFNGQIECVKILIKYGANVNARNIENSTPLNEAVCKGHVEVAKLLIQHGAETNPSIATSTPLHDAALSSQEKCIELLLDHGADVTAQDCHYGTALHISCFKQNYNCVRILLNAGSNVNSQKMHLTPLHYATDGYHGGSSDAIVQLLLAVGADCRMKSSLGRLPIDRVPPMSNAASILNYAMYNPRKLVDLANISIRNYLQPVRERLDAVEWLPPSIKRKIFLE